MKNIVVASVAGLFSTLMIAGAASAADNYVGLSGTYSTFSDADVRSTFANGTTSDLDATFDNGMGVQLRGGRDFGAIRAELELGWRDLQLDSLKQGASSHTNVNGDADLYTLMVNAAYDVELDSAVTPYIMAGVGVVHIDGSGSANDTDGDAYTFSKKATTAGGQLGLGASFEISPTMDLVGGYSFLYVPTDDFGKDQNINIHTGQIGVNYKF